MNDRASHRGPDSEGFWVWSGDSSRGSVFRDKSQISKNANNIIGFAHRRLSIIDLTDAGHQPMALHNSRLWITYNGEIYNYIELRKELEKKGNVFLTQSDTEVALSAYKQWGVDCFKRFNGMWGLVLADLDKGVLVLSRDRLGIKPLYIWSRNNEFAFASEIKQFLALPGFQPKANLNAIAEYVDSGYESVSETFFQDVCPFPPGCYAEIPIAKPEIGQITEFWNPSLVTRSSFSRVDMLHHTRSLFADSVKIRLRSDVPVGICLSGGLDSSTILAQAHALWSSPAEPLHAFSAVYKEKEFDESPYIRHVLHKFPGNIHSTITPTPAMFVDDLDDFVYHHDEPVGSMSQYAAWTVMQAACQKNVPVLLNGQGGDEIFSGYWPAYYLFLKKNITENPLNTLLSLLGAIGPHGNPDLIREAFPHFQRYLNRKRRDNRCFLRDNLSAFGHTTHCNWATEAQKLSPAEYRLAEIRMIHLPRLLKWDDRNSMAFGIEGRYPFLDYRLVEWLVSLPPEVNFCRGWNKYLIRESFADVLPDQIRWRRSKVGFVTPQSMWFNRDLKPVFMDWIDNLSERFHMIVEKDRFCTFAKEILCKKKIHRMDEKHKLIVRLFFLDKWLRVFQVEI